MSIRKNICEINRWQLWKNKINNLTPVEFVNLGHVRSDSVCLDVRTEREWLQQPVDFPNILQLNYLGDKFLEEFEALDPWLSYFVFCKTGRRSIRVCALLYNAGFKSIYNLDGGLLAVSKLK